MKFARIEGLTGLTNELVEEGFICHLEKSSKEELKEETAVVVLEDSVADVLKTEVSEVEFFSTPEELEQVILENKRLEDDLSEVLKWLEDFKRLSDMKFIDFSQI